MGSLQQWLLLATPTMKLSNEAQHRPLRKHQSLLKQLVSFWFPSRPRARSSGQHRRHPGSTYCSTLATLSSSSWPVLKTVRGRTKWANSAVLPRFTTKALDKETKQQTQFRLRAELATSGSTLLKREDDHHARVLGEASRVSPPVAQHDDHPHLSGRLAQVQALHLKKSCMTMFLTIQGSSSGSHPGFKRRRSN